MAASALVGILVTLVADLGKDLAQKIFEQWQRSPTFTVEIFPVAPPAQCATLPSKFVRAARFELYFYGPGKLTAFRLLPRIEQPSSWTLLEARPDLLSPIGGDATLPATISSDEYPSGVFEFQNVAPRSGWHVIYCFAGDRDMPAEISYRYQGSAEVEKDHALALINRNNLPWYVRWYAAIIVVAVAALPIICIFLVAIILIVIRRGAQVTGGAQTETR